MGLYTSQSKDENIGKMEYYLKHPQSSLPTDQVRTKTTTVFYLSDQLQQAQLGLAGPYQKLPGLCGCWTRSNNYIVIWQD